MKNLIKKSLLITLAMFVLVVNAAENKLTIEVVSHDSKVVQLVYINNDGPSEVTIKDINGFQLYKTLIIDNEFFKTFDLSRLPNGEYFFEVNGKTKIRTTFFSVTSNKIELKEESIEFKPIVRFKNNIVYLSKFALNEESLELFLYDKNQHLIYDEKLHGSINLGRILNLSNLDSGSYRLAIKSGGRLHSEILKKTK